MTGKLITFEGIDGVGKTTISKEVTEELKKINDNIVYINKKDISIYETAYVNQHMQAVKSVLWDYDPKERLFDLGDNHWLYLNLSWFSALYDAAIKKELEKGKIVIVDGWYYKLYSRFVIKNKYKEETLKYLFFNVPEPDLVYYLTADFQTILSRRTELLPTEMGEMDANKKLLNNNFHNFINYQEKVKHIMDNLSITKGWKSFINDDFTKCVNSITIDILNRI